MKNNNVVTRFAPSPTGELHIGSARTALFNALFAKHHNGKFLLRIEDTDKKRSTKKSIDSIFSGLSFLGINYDSEPVYQSHRIKRHQEVALQLLKKGSAYYCYETTEELLQTRKNRMSNQQKKWRDSQEPPPKNIKPSIRIKSPYSGKTILHDLVQGTISIENQSLDDFIILRSDGMPTYMLASVVDDFDMKITHIIRGNDHISNTFRQIQIYNAMNWPLPKYAHIPLIHGPDGKRLSKRHGALGIQFYQQEGFLSDSLINYLLRLGWSHGNDEIISKKDAIAWFDLEHIGQSPAKLELQKMRFLNQVYMKKHPDIVAALEEWRQESFEPKVHLYLKKGIPELLKRSYTLKELFEKTIFYRKRPIINKKIYTPFSLQELLITLNKVEIWNQESLDITIKTFCSKHNILIKFIMPILRQILTGQTESPGILSVMISLGKEETCARLQMIIASNQKES